MRLLILALTLVTGIGIGGYLYLTGKLPAYLPQSLQQAMIGKPAASAGQFKGNIRAELLAPSRPADTFRDIKLLEAFGFVDSKGVHWDVSPGYVSNGASIPPTLWPVVGGPLDGPYRDAAVIHDYYCEKRNRSSDDTHRMFYEAAVARGTSENIASTMYMGIIFGGPRWELAPKKAGFTLAQATAPKVDPGLVNKQATAEQKKAAEDLKAWIEREKPSLEQIKKRAEELRAQTGVSQPK
ncbi:MAG: DUF1353 domain-containing protein [Hyphomicrobiaceae bacterium]|nr:DUF1353 domain-containing protein [Hyphomicrobiaceae bacterium]